MKSKLSRRTLLKGLAAGAVAGAAGRVAGAVGEPGPRLGKIDEFRVYPNEMVAKVAPVYDISELPAFLKQRLLSANYQPHDSIHVVLNPMRFGKLVRGHIYLNEHDRTNDVMGFAYAMHDADSFCPFEWDYIADKLIYQLREVSVSRKLTVFKVSRTG